MTALAVAPAPLFDFKAINADNLLGSLNFASRRQNLFANEERITEVCREFITLAAPLLANYIDGNSDEQRDLGARLQAYLLAEKMGHTHSQRALCLDILDKYGSSYNNIKAFAHPHHAPAWAALQYLMSPEPEINRAWHFCLHAGAVAKLHSNIGEVEFREEVFVYFHRAMKDREVL